MAATNRKDIYTLLNIEHLRPKKLVLDDFISGFSKGKLQNLPPHPLLLLEKNDLYDNHLFVNIIEYVLKTVVYQSGIELCDEDCASKYGKKQWSEMLECCHWLESRWKEWIMYRAPFQMADALLFKLHFMVGLASVADKYWKTYLTVNDENIKSNPNMVLPEHRLSPVGFLLTKLDEEAPCISGCCWFSTKFDEIKPSSREFLEELKRYVFKEHFSKERCEKIFELMEVSGFRYQWNPVEILGNNLRNNLKELVKAFGLYKRFDFDEAFSMLDRVDHVYMQRVPLASFVTRIRPQQPTKPKEGYRKWKYAVVINWAWVAKLLCKNSEKGFKHYPRQTNDYPLLSNAFLITILVRHIVEISLLLQREKDAAMQKGYIDDDSKITFRFEARMLGLDLSTKIEEQVLARPLNDPNPKENGEIEFLDFSEVIQWALLRPMSIVIDVLRMAENAVSFTKNSVKDRNYSFKAVNYHQLERLRQFKLSKPLKGTQFGIYPIDNFDLEDLDPRATTRGGCVRVENVSDASDLFEKSDAASEEKVGEKVSDASEFDVPCYLKYVGLTEEELKELERNLPAIEAQINAELADIRAMERKDLTV